MSEREKQILEGVSKLPDKLQDRFLDQIQGASMALDMLGTAPAPDTQKKGGAEHEPGKGGLS